MTSSSASGKKGTMQKATAEKATSPQTPIKEILDGRKSKELVLAFAGPVGCGISLAIKEAKAVLISLGYAVHVIKLSDFIESAAAKGEIKKTDCPADRSAGVHRIINLQNGGNELRKISTSILAELAVEKIATERGATRLMNDEDATFEDYIPPRTAYLIDQIKHQDEVSLLRQVYGGLFHLVGVISVAEKRKSRLVSALKVRPDETSYLMERDRREDETHGQQLDKALQMADFFISTDYGTTAPIERKLRRFFGLLHGENGITPTSQEYGMYAAFSAGLKSACLSRQVGAAIANANGKIVSTGCNDVPKALGGLYTYDDGEHDVRCVHREEQICFNNREKSSHKEDIRQALSALTRIDKDGKERPLIPSDSIEGALSAIFKASHIEDLTEFSRAVHAEMDAIISLARSGTPGLVGASLFTTTFPCHSCARHIVAAGITKVYYIEPYEKSLAQKLHSDSIAFETEDDHDEKIGYIPSPNSTGMVRFIHFEGVAPRQYLNLFTMSQRKEKGTGTVIKIVPSDAAKTVGAYLDSYRDFETKVVSTVVERRKNTTPFGVVVSQQGGETS